MPKIKLRRGLEANLPVLDEGEPGFTTDTEKFFIGSQIGNVQFAKQSDLATNTANIATNTTNIASNTAQLADISTNVKRSFGAKGDGVTDDSAAIQNAINSIKNIGGTVYFPPGTYIINTPLNLTNISKGVIFKGSGMNDNGTIIYGLTNGIMLDCAGSPYMQIKDIQLKARYESNASKLGILFSRSTTNLYAEFSLLENVKIDLGSIPTANSNNGTIGIYNYGAELHRYRNIYVLADRPVCFVYNNTFNITSTFTTLTNSGTSMSECVIDGSSTLTGYANAAVRLDNTANIKLDNIYILLGQADGANNLFAIECIGGQSSFEITGHIESYEQLINGKGALLYDPMIRVSKQIMSANKDQIVLDGTGSATGIYGGHISLVNMLNPSYVHNLISQIGTAHNGIINCRINLYSNQGINTQYGYTTGNIIHSQDPNPSISLSGAGYNNGTFIMRQDKVRLNGTFDTDVVSLSNSFKLNGVTYSYGGNAPTTGTWGVGDTVFNNFPNSTSLTGWKCIVAGTPGTWLPFGQLISQASSPILIGTGGTVNTGGYSVQRVNPSAAVTGIIMQAGTFGGQEVWVINEAAAANNITFAASGSNVADGSSDIISGGSARKFVWNAGTSLWYKAS